MKSKRGFTMVELLAVIAIVAVLAIIVLPNVLNMFNDAKKNTFETELKNIYNAAEKEYVNDSLSSSGNKVYSFCKNGDCGKSLKLTGGKDIEYYIEFNSSGKVTRYYATNGSYEYKYTGTNLKANQIKGVDIVADIAENDRLIIDQYGYTTKNESDPSVCRFKLITAMGSFSETEDVKEICFKPTNDGYTFTSSSAWIISGARTSDSYYQIVTIDRALNQNSYLRIYEDETKSNLLAEFKPDEVRDYNRISLNNNGYSNAVVRSKKLGFTNRTDYYIEASDDMCRGYDCPEGTIPYWFGYTSSLTNVTYSGPWITDPSTLQKIEILKNSLAGNRYQYGGITRCNMNVDDEAYYASDETECTGNTYYIKYNDTTRK